MGFLAKAAVGALALGAAYGLGKSATNDDDKSSGDEPIQNSLNAQQLSDDDLPQPQTSEETGGMRYRNGTGLFLDNQLNPSCGKKLFQRKILHLNIYTLFIGLIL